MDLKELITKFYIGFKRGSRNAEIDNRTDQDLGLVAKDSLNDPSYQPNYTAPRPAFTPDIRPMNLIYNLGFRIGYGLGTPSEI